MLQQWLIRALKPGCRSSLHCRRYGANITMEFETFGSCSTPVDLFTSLFIQALNTSFETNNLFRHKCPGASTLRIHISFVYMTLCSNFEKPTWNRGQKDGRRGRPGFWGPGGAVRWPARPGLLTRAWKVSARREPSAGPDFYPAAVGWSASTRNAE